MTKTEPFVGADQLFYLEQKAAMADFYRRHPECLAPKPAPKVESPYLTVPEAAQYLRSTRNTVYDWVKRGKLHPEPGVRGRLLFTRDALDRFTKTRRRR